MKRVLFLSACLLAVAACEKNTENILSTPEQGASEVFDVRVAPVMTKVTQTAFESGDAIGLTITRSSGAYATNEKMTFDGSVFSGSLKWYAEGAEGATLSAYYPFAEATPTAFAVQADQSAGTSTSDFVAGSKENVLPSAHAVTIPFRHKLSLLSISVTNNAEGEISSLSVSGARLTAKIGADFTATVDETAAAGSIVAHKTGDGSYVAILPPQTVTLAVKVVTAGNKQLTQALKEAVLEGGKKYSVSIVVNPGDLTVVTDGDITDWDNGGNLDNDDTPAGDLVENLSENYIVYHGDKYTVAKMKDGKWWMTQNLRYFPDGFTPGDELTNVTAGVYYPIKLKDGVAEFDVTEEAVNARGLLYQAEAALGLKVGDLTSVEAAKALEGTQGICPKGWHVPTADDILNLVGKAVSPLTNNENAPYYDKNLSNGSIALLNADGFNMEAFGAVTIQDNTKTSGTFMGVMNGYDHLASGMFCGSTYAGVTYNEKDVETSGVKNLQFYGLMPMTNKSSESAYTCSGTKVSYRIAAPLRCVRDNELE